MSRGLLRHILAAYTGVRPRELRFRYGARGKPALDGAAAARSVHFNLSHSADLLVLAVTPARPLGVDVERIRPVPDAGKIVRRLGVAGTGRRGPALGRVTDSEPGPGEDAAAFLVWWTRREACAKAAGIGLPACPGGARTTDTDEAAAKWRCYRFAPAAGYVGTLAIAGCDWRLVPWSVAP